MTSRSALALGTLGAVRATRLALGSIGRLSAAVLLAGLALLGPGCSSESRPLDASVDDAATDAFVSTGPVLTPCPAGWQQIPAGDHLPARCEPWPDEDPLTPPDLACPVGWRTVPADSADGVAACDPWPEEGPHPCAPDEGHFPGEPGCSVVGTACDEGNWAIDLPAEAQVLYVEEGRAAGGTGALDDPFGTIGEAVRAASAGTIVALSKGTFDERVVLGAGVTLWGACVGQTLVTRSVTAESGVILVRGREAIVRNLRVSGRRIGIEVEGEQTTATIEDVVVESAQRVGLLVRDGATAVGRTLVVRDTQPDSDGTRGRGLGVETGAYAAIERAILERNHESGVTAAGPGVEVYLAGVVVRDTLEAEAYPDAWALRSDDGALVRIERSVLQANRRAALVARGVGTVLQVVDVVVRDTLPWSDGLGGAGLLVSTGAHAEVTRALFERNRDRCIQIADPGTSLLLTDAIVRDTESRLSDQRWGRGLEVQDGARADVERALFARNREVAVFAALAGTRLRLENVIVSETRSRQSDSGSGVGLEISEGAVAEIRRAVLEGNHDSGVRVASPETNVHLSDIVVRDTRSSQQDGSFGRGMTIVDGATVTLERAAILRNREIGIAAIGPGAAVEGVDVVIRESMERECADDVCEGYGAGVGAGAYGGAALALDRFEIGGSALCGVQIASGYAEVGVPFPELGAVDLRDGVITDNPIAVNVQDASFDLARLQNRVSYWANGRNFDSSTLPVPSAAH